MLPGQDIEVDVAGAHPQRPVALGDLLLFAADDGVSGRELWASDGTGAGTLLVKDIAPGQAGSLEVIGYPPVALPGFVLFGADGHDQYAIAL